MRPSGIFRALRITLLWLAMVAVPFQGYAAASMAFCGMPLDAISNPAAHASHDMTLPHVPAADASHVAHSTHAAPAAMEAGGHDAHAHASSGADSGLHKCGTCGACHAVGLIGATDRADFAVLPQAARDDDRPTPATLAPRVLDKPPRA